MTEGVFKDEDGSEHQTYGISAIDSDGNVSATYSDIFLDKKVTENLVELCNESKLELCHLADVIEDALT